MQQVQITERAVWCFMDPDNSSQLEVALLLPENAKDEYDKYLELYEAVVGDDMSGFPQWLQYEYGFIACKLTTI